MHTYIVHGYNIYICKNICTYKESMHMCVQRWERVLPCKTIKKHVNPH